MVLKYCRPEGQSGHDAAYGLLYDLLGARPEIRRSPSGKPFIAGGPYFSLSHTPKHAFCVVSEKNIGIDAEECDRPVNPRLIARWCSPAEVSRIREPSDFLRLWVLKESFAKFTGRGIGNYLRETDFDPYDPRIQIIDGCFVAIWE